MTSRNHDEAMADYFREHPDFAADMLTQIFVDGEPGDLAVLLQQFTLSLSDQTPDLAGQGTPALTEESITRGPSAAELIAVVRAMRLLVKVTPGTYRTAKRMEAAAQAA